MAAPHNPTTSNHLASLRPANSADVDQLVNKAVRRAHAWREEPKQQDKQDGATQQLAALLRDEEGITFTMDFVDRVMRPEDDAVAANALRATAEGGTCILPRHY